MPQFFIKPSNIVEDKCIIEGDDFHHLSKVRRAKTGEVIELRSTDGKYYKGKISEITQNSIIVQIIQRFDTDKKHFDLELTVYASILKGKAYDLALQKAVETGVDRIVPIVSERTIPSVDRKSNKKERWEKIVLNAAKQCLRKDIPVLEDVMTFKEAVAVKISGLKIIAHPEPRSVDIRKYFEHKEKVRDVSLLIGPEGGFTDKEVDLAERNGWDSVVFGFTSLRAETASIVLPAIIVYEWSALNAVIR